jgi:ketopantoate reductase
MNIEAPGQPRVAVVGAGAWGATLAILLGKVDPVILLAQRRQRRLLVRVSGFRLSVPAPTLRGDPSWRPS